MITRKDDAMLTLLAYASRDWTATRSVKSGDSTNYVTDIVNGSLTDAAIGAADIIYGGTRDDILPNHEAWKEAA